MTRSIPPRTMRNIWDEEKKRRGSNSFRSIPSRSTMRDWYDKESVRQKYSNQINSIKTSGTSGALYKKGELEFLSEQGWSRNIYERAGHRGMIYKKTQKNQKLKSASGPSDLKKVIDNTEAKIFEIGKKISIVAELYLIEKITNIFYDAIKEEIVVHADKDYSIPLKIKKGNPKMLGWSYNNGIVEIVFEKDKNNCKE